MNLLRLGIVGAGSVVARKHLLALAEVSEIAVAGLCRRDAGELRALADRFRIPRHEDLGFPAAGAEDGVRALELLEAVRASADKGRSVALPLGEAQEGRSMPLAPR